jgi:hypothetical protein
MRCPTPQQNALSHASILATASASCNSLPADPLLYSKPMAFLYALAALAYLAIGCLAAIFCVGEEPEKNRLWRAASFVFYALAWFPVVLGMIVYLAVKSLTEREGKV